MKKQKEAADTKKLATTNTRKRETSWKTDQRGLIHDTKIEQDGNLDIKFPSLLAKKSK